MLDVALPDTMEVDVGGRDDDMDIDEENHTPVQQMSKPTRRSSMSEDEERQRRASIKAILSDTTIPEVERRKSIQHLMDGRRNSLGGSSNPGNQTPSSLDGNSCREFELQSPAVLAPLVSSSSQFFSDSTTCMHISNEQTKLAELTRPHCSHYERKCTVIAPCCSAVFGCRICHDDCPILPPQMAPEQARRRHPRSASLPSSFTNMSANPGDTHHAIDRFAIKEVICRECYTRQSSKTNQCIACGVIFSDYHCIICNLWMSNEEHPYHCSDCGFCRVGGAENFKHCHDCGMCIDRTLYSNHNCKVGKYKSNCPVCQEYLFSSRSASHEMPCGHAIHWDCFRQLAAHDSRCPVCKKTAETKERMMPTWNAMATGIALQPIPPELARVVNITCNDCERADDARAWHFLGVQCRNCSSFNTVVDRIVLSGEDAQEFLEAMERRNDIMEGLDQDNPRPHRRRVSRRRSLM